MKVPIFRVGQMPAECVDLPAVAAVAGGGFLSLAVPVARFGVPSSWETYVLLPSTERHRLVRDGVVAPWQIDYLAIIVKRKAEVDWNNADEVWVSARWLAARFADFSTDSQSHGIALLRAVVAAALRLTREGV